MTCVLLLEPEAILVSQSLSLLNFVPAGTLSEVVMKTSLAVRGDQRSHHD